MKISIVLTVFNEEGNIAVLLESLLNQTRKPKEIIVIDGGSTDKTSEIIKHYEKKFGFIKLIKHKSSRSEGRNFGIEIAKGDIIAVTDAGCIAQADWLEKLTEPFENSPVEVSAGFYKMVYQNDFERAETLFIGVLPSRFGVDFLPSSRSVAFRKSLWERVGGYPENLKGAGEDMAFNYKILKSGAKIARIKSAVVNWKVPDSLSEFFSKIYSYAKGDAESQVFIFPTKNIQSHNIKALLILFRYLVFLALFLIGFRTHIYLYVFTILFTVYLAWAYRKVYLEFGRIGVSFWGIILQLTCDLAVMTGFIFGLWDTISKYLKGFRGRRF